MRLLLDTHILIWSVFRSARLKPTDLEMVRDPSVFVAFSVASIWEIAIKRALRGSAFDVDPVRLAATARLDFTELPVVSAVAARVADLPLHHRDPFDRLLVAQAVEEDALLLTVDAQLAAYAPHVLLIS